MSSSKRTAAILVCILWCTFTAHFAAAATQWARTIGGSNTDVFYSFDTTGDGGYIVAGITNSFGAGGFDVWCVKLDSSGSVQWQKTCGGASDDYANAVRATSDGGCILVGYTKSFGVGGKDAWCIKLDSSGNVLWQRIFGGAYDDYINAAQATSDGGCIFAAVMNEYGLAGSPDVCCVKLDSSGNVLWERIYGSIGQEWVNALQTTSDGGCILAGRTDFGAGLQDAWCMKLDSSGNISWQRTYGGALADRATAVQATSDGGFVLAATTYNFGSNNTDAWCVKLDSSGNVLWQTTFGGPSSEIPRALQATSDGGCILAGYRSPGYWLWGQGDAWCVKLDSSGNVSWQKKYGGTSDEDACALQATNDGGYVLAGGTATFGAGRYDGWVLKLSSTGDIDPSCASFIAESSATTIVSAVTTGVSAAVFTTMMGAGSTTSASIENSTATTTLLCSSGTAGPVITSIKSKTGKPGSTATIRGSGFSANKSDNTVYFGKKKAEVKRAATSRLQVKIPTGCKKGKVGVYVTVKGVKSNIVQFTVK